MSGKLYFEVNPEITKVIKLLEIYFFDNAHRLLILCKLYIRQPQTNFDYFSTILEKTINRLILEKTAQN